MKKIFTLLALAACCATAVWSCSDDYDDSEIRQEIENLKQELDKIKTQLGSLQTIIDAVDKNKFITDVTSAENGYTITFSDGKTISISDGKDGSAAPAIGIDLFEGVYYWTIGGKGNWLTTESGDKIAVAGTNGADGKTPRLDVDEDGYWTVDGTRITGKDGKPVKATGADGTNGKDGDSFFKSVTQTDDEVIFTLSDNTEIRLPKAKEINFVITAPNPLILKYGTSKTLTVTQHGVLNYSISKPDGWRAALAGDALTITAPVAENVYAEKEGKVSVVAVGATHTVVAVVEVKATDVILEGDAGSSDSDDGNPGAGNSSCTEW